MTRDDSKVDGSSLSIVHVVRQFYPAIGGIENYVEQLALQQVRIGHRVRVVTLNRVFSDAEDRQLAAYEVRSGIEIHRVGFRGSHRYPIAPAVLGHLGDADLVHVHAIDFFADFLAWTRPIHRKPLVLTTHGGFFHSSFAQRLKRVYFTTVSRFSLTQYGAIIACSVEDLRTFETITDDRLVLIANPVDVTKFADLADPASMTIIYFGRLAPHKGVERLIEWFAGLARTSAAWRLIVAGKPMGTTIDELQAVAAATGVANRVEFHSTPSDDELRTLIGRSGLYACASSYEGFGMAAVEAASAGLYPILSDIAPFVDTVGRLGFGQIVDFEAPADFIQTYGRVATYHDQFRANFDRQAIRSVLAPFAWQTAVTSFEHVYRRLTGISARRIGELAVDVRSGPQATAEILQMAARRQGLMVAFCNANSTNLAASNPRFRLAMREALLLNDGVGVNVASRRLYRQPFPENLNGTDFVPALLAATQMPLELFLYGSKPGVAERAAAIIEQHFPMVSVVGSAHGYLTDAEQAGLVERIARSGANMLIVALGQPRQELWAARHWRDIAGPTMCVGALLDFLSGDIPRAPTLVRRLRLEWAYRLAREPWRLARRYLAGNLAFLARLTRQLLVGPRI